MIKKIERNLVFSIFILLLIVIFTYALPVVNTKIKSNDFLNLIDNPFISSILTYQLTTLLLAIVLIGLLFVAKNDSAKKYLSFGIINSKVEPEKYIGLHPKKNENWLHIGINFALIVSIVTGIVLYFQAFKGNNISSENMKYVPLIFIFAIMNSFTEEIITRFGVVVTLDGIISKQKICIISAFIFGSVHYFGTPGGFLGVVLAGFLGWLLSKSIIETKGIFWSWLIHCLQDIIIFSGLFYLMI
ncbi:MAG: CPBP family intramembrane glutamic endopeptidase [Rectinemataceae bacterium]